MSKQPNIRWRNNDVAEIERLVRNYNAKLYRIQKKDPSAVDYLPSKLNKKEVMKSIETRQDFKRVSASIKRFSQRGAEKPFTSDRGLKTTQWAVDEFKRNQKEENKRRAAQRKKLGEMEVKQGGKPTGAKRKEMGRIKENAVKESTKDPKHMSAKEFEKASRMMENKMRESYNAEQRRQMQINYIRGLMREGYDEELTNYLLTVPTDKFMEVIDTDESASFDFIYDPLALKVRQDELWNVWEEHGTGENVLGITLDDIGYDEWQASTYQSKTGRKHKKGKHITTKG